MSASASHAAILGGGLAGMSAAVALAQEGFHVTIVEKRVALGGRAGSHQEAVTGEWVDNCQHVLMPCCTNLLDFYTRIGVQDKIRFYPVIPFLSGRGKVSFLKSSRLPAPLHCAPSFMALKFLSFADKLRIARGLWALISVGRRPTAEAVAAMDWLLAHGQSSRTLERFWHPILVSALNEDLERASVHYAAKVFVEAFLWHPQGWWLGIPSVPLSNLYGDPLPRFLERRQGLVLLQQEVAGLVLSGKKVAAVRLVGGATLSVDYVVLALPWRAAADLLPGGVISESGPAEFGNLEASPITGIHLWFDRPVTDLDFAALPGKQVQWLFNKSRIFNCGPAPGAYLQLITSASRCWLQSTKNQILEICLRDLREALPEVAKARLVKSYVLKEPSATFSPSPANERRRPPSQTVLQNLFLAGDWVRTGWPATMEGAVRAGYMAAEGVLRASGRETTLLVPDLLPSGFMRCLKERGGNIKNI